MDAREILSKVDILGETASDEAICAYLEDVCPKYHGDAIGKAAIYNELGSVCRRNGWYEKGEKAFLTAAEALEKENIKDGNYATTINNLAGLYRLWGNKEKSMELFALCREIYWSLPDIPADMLASSCNNLGLLYLDKREYQKAMEEFSRAQEIIAACPENLYVHAVTAGNMGYAYYGLGQMDSAAESMLRAARLIRSIDEDMYNNYMSLHRRLGGKEEA